MIPSNFKMMSTLMGTPKSHKRIILPIKSPFKNPSSIELGPSLIIFRLQFLSLAEQ
jgi:hypothetical protein